MIAIRATFEEIKPDEPDGPYHVDIHCPDYEGTGSSISLDHADGNYNAGDLVTVSVNWAAGTQFSNGGLSNSDYTDVNGNEKKIDFTKVDESTYVRLSCFFDFIKYHVTYETDFGDAQISDEDKAKFPSHKPNIFLKNDNDDGWTNGIIWTQIG